MRIETPPAAGRNGRDAHNRHPAVSESASNPADQWQSSGEPRQDSDAETDPFQVLVRQFKELSDLLWYYLSAKSDTAKLHVRAALIRMTFALLAFVIVASLAVMGMWFIVSGIADGLGTTLGQRPWAGRILTGFLLMTTLWVWTRFALTRFTRAALDATVAKFERQKSRHRDRQGHSVTE